MMEKILVEVGYYDFYFDCMEDAVAFAETAKNRIEDGATTVKISVRLKKAGEVASEDGED